jgi:mannose-6-phosphate isomerase
MQQPVRLRNPVQNYAWGSRTAIPELTGEPNPSNRPQAELWMGAHPLAPSQALYEGHWQPLTDLVQRFAQEILGAPTAARFHNRLPYLFKVLAAAEPLSIQAHPDRQQARAGYERENALRIDLRDPQRNYKDPNHKPECLCALTPFWALCGFRKAEEVSRLLARACPRTLAGLLQRLRQGSGERGLQPFFTELMQLPAERKRQAIAEAGATAEDARGSADEVMDWIRRLRAACLAADDREMPADVGILSPCYLNLIRLQPGQALYLDAGVLHAYLSGTGMELMANSDNVIRGGLTRKHTSIRELLSIVDFSPRPPPILAAPDAGPGEWVYATPAEEFQLSLIRVSKEQGFVSAAQRSVEILFCHQGRGTVEVQNRPAETLTVNRGDAMLVPAAAGPYRILGDVRLFKATVPLPPGDNGRGRG